MKEESRAETDAASKTFGADMWGWGTKGGVALLLAAGLAGPFAANAAIDRDFLRDLLEIPSVTADVDEVNRAIDRTRERLERDGLGCLCFSDETGRKHLWSATVPDLTPDYVLAVHLDVVAAEPEQFKPRVEGDVVHARGAHDCKGNVAIACDVLRRLKGKASVGVIFASNEEFDSTTVALMVRRGYRPTKMGIVIDAGTYGVFFAQKGNDYITVRANGRGGHSSMAMWLENPIEKLMRGYERFMSAWPAVPDDGWGDLVAPTVIRAGAAENAIPDAAEMVLNLRSVTPDAAVRATNLLAECGLETVNVRTAGAPLESDPNHPEIRRLLASRQARWPEKKGGLQRMLAITDAHHLAGLGVPVAIIGSMGGNAHGRGEWGDMKNMDENADSLVEFLSGK